MDFQKLLQGVDCACGKHHSCDIDFVAIEHGAIRHLTALTEGYGTILLVADENTYAAAGSQTEAALSGRQDLLQTLNRMSSYLYILMIQEKAGEERPWKQSGS